ncbi:hypothetical protein GUITHDRAFT_133930 [Guillardia theta CCMP2712]|uniref:Uncharacterized protein n=1 Tax=Guillardia theta (strain CCMP2712) TaxID=905079 RepID=L1JUZ9_GUITC|nr:hypothetical protein GUITHDRAFT_133930 [Guillardia theta CCMP2712]EKX52217.1 hypothetical protein GUITHDRAFT_133930 [Guillardia theta CCMP2712]|eukprot:XP_005839197.1 hypothetical protein GUITHDRAFT_133930 [Guillardia theta CCMP2712]
MSLSSASMEPPTSSFSSALALLDNLLRAMDENIRRSSMEIPYELVICASIYLELVTPWRRKAEICENLEASALSKSLVETLAEANEEMLAAIELDTPRDHVDFLVSLCFAFWKGLTREAMKRELQVLEAIRNLPVVQAQELPRDQLAITYFHEWSLSSFSVSPAPPSGPHDSIARSVSSVSPVSPVPSVSSICSLVPSIRHFILLLVGVL